MNNHPVCSKPSPERSVARQIEDLAGDENFITSLARGLAVIQAFQERKRPLTIAQISHRTEIPRAAVRRCLLTLMQLGYVSQNERYYGLRPKVLSLGYAYLSSTPLALLAQPVLDRLAEELGESCQLATLDNDEVLYVTRSSTARRRTANQERCIGSRVPAYCSAAGRILLASREPEWLGQYLQQATLPIKTSRTVGCRHHLQACLDQSRQSGWCIADQELEPGMRSLAVPIRSVSGEVVAAIEVETAVSQVSLQRLEQHFLPILQQASRGLSVSS